MGTFLDEHTRSLISAHSCITRAINISMTDPVDVMPSEVTATHVTVAYSEHLKVFTESQIFIM